MSDQPKPPLFYRLKKRFPLQIFPKNTWYRFLNGIGWILEAQLENYVAGIIFSKYEWEILGPANIGLFMSEFFATVYGSVSLFLAFWRFMGWFEKKYQSGGITTP